MVISLLQRKGPLASWNLIMSQLIIHGFIMEICLRKDMIMPSVLSRQSMFFLGAKEKMEHTIMLIPLLVTLLPTRCMNHLICHLIVKIKWINLFCNFHNQKFFNLVCLYFQASRPGENSVTPSPQDVQVHLFIKYI